MADDLLDDEMNPQNQEEDKLSTPLWVLSFCIPIAGAVIYFMNKDQYPAKSKAACNAALIGVGVSIVLNILMTMLGGMG